MYVQIVRPSNKSNTENCQYYGKPDPSPTSELRGQFRDDILHCMKTLTFACYYTVQKEGNFVIQPTSSTRHWYLALLSPRRCGIWTTEAYCLCNSETIWRCFTKLVHRILAITFISSVKATCWKRAIPIVYTNSPGLVLRWNVITLAHSTFTDPLIKGSAKAGWDIAPSSQMRTSKTWNVTWISSADPGF